MVPGNGGKKKHFDSVRAQAKKVPENGEGIFCMGAEIRTDILPYSSILCSSGTVPRIPDPPSTARPNSTDSRDREGHQQALKKATVLLLFLIPPLCSYSSAKIWFPRLSQETCCCYKISSEGMSFRQILSSDCENTHTVTSSMVDAMISLGDLLEYDTCS